MQSIFNSVLGAVLALLMTASGQALDVGALAGIDEAMSAAVKRREAAGIVTLVMQQGKVLHHGAVGMADLAKGKPMQKDSVFWIASMTKSINGAAVMLLVDEGRLKLDEPAKQWLPELGAVKLADGRAPATPITLRQLLSHTAGIAFPPRKPTDGSISLKNYVKQLLAAPLAFEPGSSYEYGFGPTVAGRIIEVVSGMSYQDFLAQRLFKPLGMKDTAFNPPQALRERIARTYKTDEDSGELRVAYNPFVTSSEDVTHMVEPSGGLFSTAADLGRFYSMVAAGGELDGLRLLSAAAVADMTKPVMAGGKPQAYAAGWQCNLQQQRTAPQMPVGGFGHGGAFATHGWIDPQSGVVTVFLVQNVMVSGSGKARDAFHGIVAKAAGLKVQPLPKRQGKGK